MKYLLLQDNNYYFRRKIPKTSQSYTFSLKSKNAKLASKVINLFLLRAEPLFQSLKSETSEDVMSNLETIIQLLENYKEEALIEYSPLEEARHRRRESGYHLPWPRFQGGLLRGCARCPLSRSALGTMILGGRCPARPAHRLPG